MELNENAEWYVRAMIFRGTQSVQNDIEKGREALKDDSIPGWVKSSLEGMISYNEQLLHEAQRYIPAELLPRV